MKRFKSIPFVSLLTISLSATALAGDITGRAAMEPGDITGILTWGDTTGVIGTIFGKIR